MNGSRRIRVSINRLVLRGVDASDGRALAAALEAELHGRLVDSDLAANPGQSRRIEKLNLGRVNQSGTAEQIGTGVARRLVRSIEP